MIKKRVCPIDKGRLNKSKQWKPPNGLDPKMSRYACNVCQEYWYYIPRGYLMSKQDIQEKFNIFL